MAVNSSSSSNDSLLHPHLPLGMDCLITGPSFYIFTAFSVTNILLFLPLYVLVLYLGLQRWRQQQRSASSAAVTSHTDVVTYHMTSMELIGVAGCTLCFCALYGHHVHMFSVGFFLRSVTWYGQTFFHILTCVERHLAVVHPVTFLSLRGERGIRIRNIVIGCVWLLSVGATTLTITGHFLIMDFALLFFSLVIISFCSLSVLCVLIRPGPGEQGGARERVDQSKRRAFHTIVAILGVLLLRCFLNLMWAVGHVVTDGNQCVMMTAVEWSNSPSSLVLPLLFLIRAGTFTCCKNNND